jgi:hypothetical protein|tara:strand:- start:2769 stop:3461 length:693 start_codon:yes stop_codon:yes gene_type:complete
MEKITTGILLQGDIREWTIPIIEEYQNTFPNSEILLSTWNNEDISKITCDVVQTKLPKSTQPYTSSKNYQIIGCQNGLKEMKSDIILKTRADLFVHNPNIFKIFLSENSKNKIMYAHSGLMKEFRQYWISDFCQLSSKDTLSTFWDLMPLHDGSDNIAAEQYYTKNYLLKIKEDSRSWGSVHDEYFIRKSYHEDFQIEFEKYAKNEFYQNLLVNASEESEVNTSIVYPTK